MEYTTKRRRLREGLVRPGLVNRAPATMVSEGQRLYYAEFARICQARHRQSTWEAKKRSIFLAMEVVEVGVDILSRRDLCRFSLKIVENIVGVLQNCLGPSNRYDVMDKALKHNMVFSLMPTYCPPLEEALVVQQFVEGFKTKLQMVKGVQFSNKLVRKEALLDAAISVGIGSIRV
jgi:hypothetical protein